MTEDLYRCASCGSVQIEKFSDDHWVCRSCGLATRGRPTQSFTEHLKDVFKAITLAKVMFPHLTQKQLTFRVGFHLHRVQEHPVNRDGFCEICHVDYSKLTPEEFKEKTGGYDKAKWIQ